MSALLMGKVENQEELAFFKTDVIPYKAIVSDVIKIYDHYSFDSTWPPSLGDIVGEVYDDYFYDTLISRAKSGEDMRDYGLDVEDIIKHEEEDTIEEYMECVQEMMSHNAGFGIIEPHYELALDVKKILDVVGLFYMDRMDPSDIVISDFYDKTRYSEEIKLEIQNAPIVEVW